MTINQEIPVYFVDIETVREKKSFAELSEVKKALYQKRFGHLFIDGLTVFEHYEENAAFYAEFSKIVCISVGKITRTKDQGVKLYIKTITGRHDKIILEQFKEAIQSATVLCAHNGKEFDFPFMTRRMMINRVTLPDILNVVGKNKWDIALQDTVEMYACNQWKYRVSMALMAEVFGIPNPKATMDGSMVADVFFSMFDGIQNDELPFEKEKEALNKIGTYCNGDVFCLANLWLAIKGYDLLTEDQIVYA